MNIGQYFIRQANNLKKNHKFVPLIYFINKNFN